VPYLAAYLAILSSKLLHTPSPRGPVLQWLYMQHAFQAIIALGVIALFKRLVPADYGLHRPRAKTYIAPAPLWGALFGVLMTLVDYAPQLLARTKPELGYCTRSRWACSTRTGSRGRAACWPPSWVTT
jgi:hypothetical protein